MLLRRTDRSLCLRNDGVDGDTLVARALAMVVFRRHGLPVDNSGNPPTAIQSLHDILFAGKKRMALHSVRRSTDTTPHKCGRLSDRCT